MSAPSRCSPAWSSTRTTRRSARPRSRSARSTTPSEAVRLAAERRWHVAEDAGRGWRRVVPSPRPLRVVGAEHTSTLLATGSVVIAVGGGGIPVAPDGRGVQGVIDKDRASAELALAIGADVLALLTGVPRVAVDFGTRWERELEQITVSEAVARPRGRRVPGRQHGPEDRVREPLRRGWARPRGDHHRGPAGRGGRRRGRHLDRRGIAQGRRFPCEFASRTSRGAPLSWEVRVVAQPLRRQRPADAGRAAAARAGRGDGAARC